VERIRANPRVILVVVFVVVARDASRSGAGEASCARNLTLGYEEGSSLFACHPET
jgi:hypothetical protein